MTSASRRSPTKSNLDASSPMTPTTPGRFPQPHDCAGQRQRRFHGPSRTRTGPNGATPEHGHPGVSHARFTDPGPPLERSGPAGNGPAHGPGQPGLPPEARRADRPVAPAVPRRTGPDPAHLSNPARTAAEARPGLARNGAPRSTKPPHRAEPTPISRDRPRACGHADRPLPLHRQEEAFRERSASPFPRPSTPKPQAEVRTYPGGPHGDRGGEDRVSRRDARAHDAARRRPRYRLDQTRRDPLRTSGTAPRRSRHQTRAPRRPPDARRHRRFPHRGGAEAGAAPVPPTPALPHRGRAEDAADAGGTAGDRGGEDRVSRRDARAHDAARRRPRYRLDQTRRDPLRAPGTAPRRARHQARAPRRPPDARRHRRVSSPRGVSRPRSPSQPRQQRGDGRAPPSRKRCWRSWRRRPGIPPRCSSPRCGSTPTSVSTRSNASRSSRRSRNSSPTPPSSNPSTSASSRRWARSSNSSRWGGSRLATDSLLPPPRPSPTGTGGGRTSPRFRFSGSS